MHEPQFEDEQNKCQVPPEGWFCTRVAGHEGPCAAWPNLDRYLNQLAAMYGDDLKLVDRITEVLNLKDNSGKNLVLSGMGYMLLYRIRTDIVAMLAKIHQQEAKK